MDLMPGAGRMAVLAESHVAATRSLQALTNAARARQVELSIHLVARDEEIGPAIDAVKASGAAALNLSASQLFLINRQLIIERTAALQLPAIYWWAEMAEEGGLVAYGPRLSEIWRRHMARLLVKLLRGAKPADLPVEQPTHFELAINLKTAKALGITVPPALLSRADEVIE